jgi:pimeloyl-ACP methyl ester carboxylesterase
MKNVYVFSGLGADQRVFKNLNFDNLNIKYIEWITPISNEHISVYAQRIAVQIKHENPILIGLSFGGIMAVEVAKLIKVEKVILISSIKNRNELPKFYKFAGKFRLNKLIPAFLLKWPNLLSYWIFGLEAKEDKKLLSVILKETDSTFLIWAIDQIVNWKNDFLPDNIDHVHGTCDRILPNSLIENKIEIENGGHLMVLNKCNEVSAAIKSFVEA